jgi:hypothetical protein
MLAEAKSKEKHGVWDLMPELTITSPCVHLGVGYNGQPYARVDFIPQSGTLDLASDGGAKFTQGVMSVASFQFPLRNNLILLTK